MHVHMDLQVSDLLCLLHTRGSEVKVLGLLATQKPKTLVESDHRCGAAAPFDCQLATVRQRGLLFCLGRDLVAQWSEYVLKYLLVDSGVGPVVIDEGWVSIVRLAAHRCDHVQVCIRTLRMITEQRF